MIGQTCCTAKDVEAVVTSFNQGPMIQEAVHSLCSQTMRPAGIIIVDDGSTDEESRNILHRIEAESDALNHVPVTVVYQPNRGVSCARNTGISRTKAPMVLVLDGDDRLQPSYIEQVSQLLRMDAACGSDTSGSCLVAASSWMQTFGTLDARVCPCGGRIGSFLAHNSCPATHILRRTVWEQSGGYDESMRSGFEDWDFFLSMLETVPDAGIGIVERPLIDYRTAPASANVKSMSGRLELMRYLMEKHRDTYQKYLTDVLLEMERVSMTRLSGWESEMVHTMEHGQELSSISAAFMEQPSYGDGGMAAAVRIASRLVGLRCDDVPDSGKSEYPL